MNNREKNLVILAAGIGTRFKGGIKQLQQVGPCGECIMEYSVYDALEAGFNRVVFIIRKDIEELFDQTVGQRIRAMCGRRGVEVVYAYQNKENLPDGFICPGDRAKPWGTGHALLSCKEVLNGGFAVINADDFYSREAFRQMSAFLDALAEGQTGVYALAGFRLGNTLSDHGSVTRGICRTDEDGWLRDIQETKHLVRSGSGAAVEEPGVQRQICANTPVSMNMWAFTPDVLERLQERFTAFLRENLLVENSEFLLPTQIGHMLAEGRVRVKVLSTAGQWYGMTYSADVPAVKEALAQMTVDGMYPSPLFQ